jgi:hypothetical protein
MADNNEVQTAPGQKLTDWANEPSIQDLKSDFELAKETQSTQITKINRWNDLLQVKNAARPKKIKGRSSVQPKLIRRQAEWRYSALTEPFLGSNKLYKLSPVTHEDGPACKQNELVLNHQFRNQINRVKFIDDFVRSTVDEGTCILRTGWKRHTVMVEEEVPVWDYFQITTPEDLDALKQAIAAKADDPRGFDESAPPELVAALEYYEENGIAVTAKQNGTQKVKVEKVLENKPTVEIRNPANVFIDPTCGGDIEKAMFVIESFETCKADLLKEGKRYTNLELVDWEGATPLNQPDHETHSPNHTSLKGIRKRIVAYEYWGFYEIHKNGELIPFVATWIGDIMIRMEINPFPDGKLPYVIVPYLPVKREIYGEPDAELLEDNQAILGAVARGMIDLLGKSANGQRGIAKGMLDPLNRRRYDNGDDYEFNPNVSPQQGIVEHKYPELPQSALAMHTMQNQEAEALTGVKSFSGGMSGEAYGDVAAGIRGVLDAASKREMAILRRLAKGIVELGQKFISMNSAFLSEEETVRVTNGEFVTVRREELAGNFDVEVDISTAEVDNAKSQDLAFMLQTMGPSEDPGMRKLILAEIADLKRMPELAHKIRTYEPQPDPLVVKQRELEIEKLQGEVDKLKSERTLNEAKARQAVADADNKDLDFVEKETGTTHARDIEKIQAQAEGNKELKIVDALTKPRKPDERGPDIDAAVGYTEISRGDPRARLRDREPTMPAENMIERDALAEEDPSLSLGSKYFDPSLDPATNPNLNV